MPSDQVPQATSNASSPGGEGSKPSPRVSSTTPTSPITMPAHSHLPGRRPYGHSASATSAGTTATKATTRPDPTEVCATAVAPYPPPIISVPSTAALIHCGAVGRGAPRQAAHSASNSPAATKRVPIWKNGGKLTSAHLIAR